MSKKRRRQDQDIRSLLEKQEDALAKLALHRDDVHYGWNSWLAGRGLFKLLLSASLIVFALLVFYSFAGMFLGW